MATLQAGLIEEMMADTFEGLEDDDLDELADTEVEKILFEVTNGKWWGSLGNNPDWPGYPCSIPW